MTGQTPITFDDVERAAERRTDPELLQRTPIERSRSISREADADVRLKMNTSSGLGR